MARKMITEYRFDNITDFKEVIFGRITQEVDMSAGETIGKYDYETSYIETYPDGLVPGTPSFTSENECEKALFLYVKHLESCIKEGSLSNIKKCESYE